AFMGYGLDNWGSDFATQYALNAANAGDTTPVDTSGDNTLTGTVSAGFALSGTDSYTVQVYMLPESVFQFDWDFVAGDYLPYNDYAYYSVSPGVISATLSSVSEVGDYGDSGWHTETYVAQFADTYTFTFGVADEGDGAYPSTLNVDNLYLV